MLHHSRACTCGQCKRNCIHCFLDGSCTAFFVGTSIVVLGFAWYQKLNPRKVEEIDCTCEDNKKQGFWQDKKSLGIITVFSTLMLTFPLYADIFYPKAEKQVIIVDKSSNQTVNFQIKGMTCQGCATHVEHEANKLSGILNITTSNGHGNATVEFDKSKTNTLEIEQAINSTGYSVTNKIEHK